jgi:nitrite reductase/ring-hydroxylating ferredoxin subunit
LSQSITPALTWHRVLALDELPDGRVKTVAAGHHSFALVHFDGNYAALSNRCPHQGGPLGEAEISGALGIRVTSADQLDDALSAAAAHDGPALIEVMTDPELV